MALQTAMGSAFPFSRSLHTRICLPGSGSITEDNSTYSEMYGYKVYNSLNFEG